MTLQQLTYLVTVAECGNITDAAERLFLSQPSLSAAIHNLEKEMGVTAFVRSNKGVTVTQEGEELLSFARMLLEQADIMQEHFGVGKKRVPKFCVSCQHYSFAVNAFVEVVKEYNADQYGFILLADNLEDAIDAVNEIASEHLEIVTKDAFQVMTKIRNAGAIFIGEYSSEPLGDYFAGPNHVLPTNGTAKFFSALSVDDFIKKSSIVYYSREALEPIHKDIIAFAEAERLTAHANSIKVRFENEK